MRPVWDGTFAMPRRVDLPGLRVRVKVIPPDEAKTTKALDGKDGMWLYTVDGAGYAGIRVDGSLPLPVQRYVLLHELLHAIHEEIDVMLEEFPEHVMTKSMARAAGLLPAPQEETTRPETDSSSPPASAVPSPLQPSSC